MDTPSTPDGGLGRPPWFRVVQVATGVAVAVAAAVVRDSVAVSPVEPGGLRWLRVLVDHPIRAGLAASLLFFALSPSRSDVEDSNEPPSS
jgi:hypothetical protein